MRLVKAAKNRNSSLLPVTAGLVFFLGFENAGLHLSLLRISAEFELNTTMMGVLVAAQYLAITVMQPLFGVIADKTGKKRVIVFAVFLFFAGCACVVRSYSAETFIVGIFALGTGYSATESLGMAALADVYPDRSEHYINIAQSFFCSGAVLSPLLIRLLMDQFGYGWRIAFILPAIGFILLLIPLALTEFPVSAPSAETPRISIRKFVSAPFLILAVTILLYGGIETGTGSFLDTLFTRGLDSPGAGAYVISLYWLAMMLSRLLFGFVGTRAEYTVIGAFFFCSVALAGLALSQSEVLSAICAVAAGAFLGPVWPMLVDMGAKMHPKSSGLAVTIMSASCGLGAAGLPVAIGWITEHSGLQPAVFTISACGWIAVLIFLFHVRRHIRS